MDISKTLRSVQLDAANNKPLYLQIATAIADKIIDNTLLPGAKLPPERELGSLFNVSRTTAINAYRWLEQQELVVTKVGSGTYVNKISTSHSNSPQVPWSQLFVPYPQTPMSSILKELVSTTGSDELISLATGMPDPSLYPIDTFKNLLAKHIDKVTLADFGYISTEGYTPLRHSVTSLLENKGINTTWDKTMILSGSQQGLYLISRVMLERGDYVVVESPTYIGAIQIFQAIGARVLVLPVSDTFPLDILEDYLIRYRPKMLFMIPTFQNPTGGVLSEYERQELINLAARHRLVIVEDDPYGDLYYQEKPPAPIKTMDTYDGVVYMGTFSKNISPGLRLGYVTGHPALIQRLALEKQYIDLHSNNFSQLLVHLYLEAGCLEEHLSMVRNEYKKRRDAMVKALKRYFDNNLQFKIPEGGFYIWCKLEGSVTSSKLLHEATKNGVFFVPGEAFYTLPNEDKEFRLSFATHPEKILVEGIKRLFKAFEAVNKSNHNKKHPSSVPIKPII
ncbi:MAG: PLP-dependent aminotransferase family protein [Firmicutes bacterium]|nr:PLP-dependent aminotransferase family protein [Bacillota bacterium]